MSHNATTIALLSIVASAGAAHSQVFIPMNAPGKNYNEGRTNTGNGIISFQAFDDNAEPVTGLWDWRTDEVFEMPNVIDDFGQALPFENYQFIPTAARGPGDPIKGIDVGLIKKPRPGAMIWNASEGAPGFSYELTNPFGLDSWSTNANADASIIAGALYGDLDGNGVSRHAVRWVNGGNAELMPVPAGTRGSEVWWTSGDGVLALGAITEQGMPSDKPKGKPPTTRGMQGIIWHEGGGDPFRIVDPGVAGAESLILTTLSLNQTHALTWGGYADETTRGGLYNIDSDTFTLLDGGDINGDGQIDLLDRHDSVAYALSADGSIIAGSYTLPGGIETAALWTTGDNYQMHNLATYLQGLGVIGLDGWHLTSITGVSADGTLFSGSGFNPAGQADVWVALIPTPGTGALLALGAGLAARRSRR